MKAESSTARQSGKVLFERTYGLADLEHHVPVTAQSMFYVGSLAKQFTAAVVLMLADDGKLRLNDRVRKFIPELPAYADQITVYHLLTHTSGLRDFLTLGFIAGYPPTESVYTEGSALKMLARQKALNFEPGAEFLYSNSGYLLLAIIAERVTGQSLDKIARTKIFEPLKMERARFPQDHAAVVQDRALSYEQGSTGWRTLQSMLDVAGAGGLYASLDDTLRWTANFDSPRIAAKALELMRTPGVLSSGKKTAYGMGFAMSSYRGLDTVEHDGGLAGYRTADLWFPSKQVSVVVLCNNAAADAVSLARSVADVVLAEVLRDAPKAQAPGEGNSKGPQRTQSLKQENLDEYIGTFTSEELDAQYHISRAGDRLTVGQGDRDPLPLRSVDRDRMTVVDLGAELHFARDQSGNIVGFDLDAGRVRGISFVRKKG